MRAFHATPHPSRGFTLVELMATIAVIAILAVLAVPQYDAFIANQRTKTMAQELMLGFLQARSEALKRNGKVYVHANGGDWAQGWVITTEAGRSYSQCEADPPPGDCLRMQQAEPGVQVVTAVDSISFNHTGRLPMSGTPSMSVCDAGASAAVSKRIVRFNLTGRPSVRLDGHCGN